MDNDSGSSPTYEQENFGKFNAGNPRLLDYYNVCSTVKIQTLLSMYFVKLFLLTWYYLGLLQLKL